MNWDGSLTAQEILLPVRGEPGANLPRVVPSRPNPWRDYRVKDQWYTAAQLHQMRLRAIDPETVETVDVKSPTVHDEMWVPLGHPLPIYRIPCPVLRRSRDGTRVQVISATGWDEWVNFDGTLHDRRAPAAAERGGN